MATPPREVEEMLRETVVGLEPIWQMGLLILGVLTISSFAVAVLCRVRPERDFSELRARTRSWWIMSAVFFCSVALGQRLSLLFFVFLSFWAMKEYMTLLRTRPADHGAMLLAFLAIPIQYYWISIGWYDMFMTFIPVYMLLILPIRLALTSEPTGFIGSVSHIQWGLMTFVFGLSHLGSLLSLSTRAGHQVNGRTLLLFLVFVVEMSDFLQYIWGKALGRHKILPAVSANKTWEGFIGGLGSAIVASLLVTFLTPFSAGEALLVSLSITLAGFAGGAVMSAMKRDLGVKDFGDLIPGHGGVLDRVDSLCYAGPIFFHYVRHFYA